ncbi:hypothetical protein OIE13_34595 [Streptosporangium sp. NBC_01810]|uniref:hypothetical protein n=1 Tax=Streptosporangium sp. NBC_01810 TaxID=2975951 RepID=UPI002DD881A1|nr:hypothetical protein [Streptosporangium sp. NBC_01810]WSA25971.1 hypothetical protein OIE13_34595 [Streptosporangium sp. NBC_01810]
MVTRYRFVERAGLGGELGSGALREPAAKGGRGSYSMRNRINLLSVSEKRHPISREIIFYKLPDPPGGLSGEAVEEVSEALEKINRDALVNILRGVPASWPVSDDDLEALGWFLEHRAPAVARRVRALIAREGQSR